MTKENIIALYENKSVLEHERFYYIANLFNSDENKFDIAIIKELISSSHIGTTLMKDLIKLKSDNRNFDTNAINIDIAIQSKHSFMYEMSYHTEGIKHFTNLSTKQLDDKYDFVKIHITVDTIDKLYTNDNYNASITKFGIAIRKISKHVYNDECKIFNQCIEYCEKFKENGHKRGIDAITGYLIDVPVFNNKEFTLDDFYDQFLTKDKIRKIKIEDLL